MLSANDCLAAAFNAGYGMEKPEASRGKLLQAFDSEEDGLFEVKFVDIQFQEKDT